MWDEMTRVLGKVGFKGSISLFHKLRKLMQLGITVEYDRPILSIQSYCHRLPRSVIRNENLTTNLDQLSINIVDITARAARTAHSNIHTAHQRALFSALTVSGSHRTVYFSRFEKIGMNFDNRNIMTNIHI